MILVCFAEQAFSTTTSLSKHRRFCDGVLHRATYQHHHAALNHQRTASHLHHHLTTSGDGFEASLDKLPGVPTQMQATPGSAKSLATLTAYLHRLYGGVGTHPAAAAGLFQFGGLPPPPSAASRQFHPPSLLPPPPLSMFPFPLVPPCMAGASDASAQTLAGGGVSESGVMAESVGVDGRPAGSADITPGHQPSTPSSGPDYDIDMDDKDDDIDDDIDRDVEDDVDDDKLDDEEDQDLEDDDGEIFSVSASSAISRCSSVVSRVSSSGCRQTLVDDNEEHRNINSVIDQLPPSDSTTADDDQTSVAARTSGLEPLAGSVSSPTPVTTVPAAVPVSPMLNVEHTLETQSPEKAASSNHPTGVCGSTVDYANLGRSLEEKQEEGDSASRHQDAGTSEGQAGKGASAGSSIRPTDVVVSTTASDGSGSGAPPHKCNFKDVATLAAGESTTTTTQQPLDLTVKQIDLIASAAQHSSPEHGRTTSPRTSEATGSPMDVLNPLQCLDRLGGPRSHHAAVAAATCLLYTSPSPRDRQKSRMPSSA